MIMQFIDVALQNPSKTISQTLRYQQNWINHQYASLLPSNIGITSATIFATIFKSKIPTSAKSYWTRIALIPNDIITENGEESPLITNNGRTSRVCLPPNVKRPYYSQITRDDPLSNPPIYLQAACLINLTNSQQNY